MSYAIKKLIDDALASLNKELEQLKASAASKEELEQLKASTASKASKEELGGLNKELELLKASTASKASKEELEQLKASKASKEELGGLNKELEQLKASTASKEELGGLNKELEQLKASKASKEELEGLNKELEQLKASTASEDGLEQLKASTTSKEELEQLKASSQTECPKSSPMKQSDEISSDTSSILPFMKKESLNTIDRIEDIRFMMTIQTPIMKNGMYTYTFRDFKWRGKKSEAIFESWNFPQPFALEFDKCLFAESMSCMFSGCPMSSISFTDCDFMFMKDFNGTFKDCPNLKTMHIQGCTFNDVASTNNMLKNTYLHEVFIDKEFIEMNSVTKDISILFGFPYYYDKYETEEMVGTQLHVIFSK